MRNSPMRGAVRLTRRISQRENLSNEPLSHREPLSPRNKLSARALAGHSARELECIT